MEDYKTEQERFWAGEFGNDYIQRNEDIQLLASNIALFAKIIQNTFGISSVIEFGSNIGLNLIALKKIVPNIEVSAIEINEKAGKILKTNLPETKLYPQSIFDFKVDYKRDFVFTKGVLIHINPDFLPKAYELLYDTSNKYICIAEYYNPSPVEINYRNNKGFLFKRDFAGELLAKYKDLSLVDYGFVYHKDNNYPQDDITWFLLKKTENLK
jgi:pseudaminic acid biosynthesis-associated methylase